MASSTDPLTETSILTGADACLGDGRQGKWEASGHIVKLQDSSEEVTMELRDSSKLPTDTTTGCRHITAYHVVINWT